MSLDGRISHGPGLAGRITGEASLLYTHRLRNTLDAILVGIGTALIDDPSLTTRLPESESGRDPVRIVLDTHLRLPPRAKLLTQQSQAPTWIFCDGDAPMAAEESLTRSGAIVYRVATGADGRLDCREVMARLGQNGIPSVLVEGGAGVHASLLRAGLVDEVYLFVAPMFIGEQGTSFQNIPKIRRILQTLCDVGLDYLTLGQAAPTLSGGEAQRVKLAAELSRPDTGRTLYLLDEPTTGLHFEDITRLLDVLHRLVDLGNTVVVIEHNLDVVKQCDWVIDLGPEAGAAGGRVVAQGTPEQVVAHARRVIGGDAKSGAAKPARRKKAAPTAAAVPRAEADVPLRSQEHRR